MATFNQQGQQVAAQYNADRITIYAQATPLPVDPDVLAAAERQLAALPLETIQDPAALLPGSHMPLRRNPLFVGREADLRALAIALKGGETAAIGQTAAASGLGGVGKTQLASEFVHRYGQFFAGGVFWLSFADPAAVPTEIATCGGPRALALHPAFHTLPLADQVQLVQAAWQSPLPRLLVFDNCEDETLLAPWRPPHGGCRVLVTSRRAIWETSLGLTTLALDVLSRAESIALLRQFRADLAPNDLDLNSIAAELGDLPLALHLAGSYLARYRYAVAPAAYLAQLRQPDLLAHLSLQGGPLTRDLSPTGHEQHVARTFKLSYDRLDPADASALALLARAAYFAPGQPIPRDLLLAMVADAEETPDTALQSEDALRRLLDLGLLEPDMAGAVRLHRLLAVFVRATIQDAAAQAAVAVALVDDAFPTVNPLDSSAWVKCVPLLAHAQAATEHAADLQIKLETTARLLVKMGLYLRGTARYTEAEELYQQALAIREKALPPGHPDVATSLNNLAALYQAQARYAEAESLFKRALAIREKALPPGHPNVVTSLNNLATLYQAQRRYAEAEPLYQRTLGIMKQAWGPEHLRVAYIFNNLATFYEAQGRDSEAEPLYQRAIGIKEKNLGPDHPDLALSLNNLADLYRARSQYAQAEPLFKRALAIGEQTLSPEHPNLVKVRENYAKLLRKLKGEK